MTDVRLAALFAVPPHMLGPPPRMRSAREQGEVQLAYAEACGLDVGEMPPLAQEAYQRRALHQLGLR